MGPRPRKSRTTRSNRHGGFPTPQPPEAPLPVEFAARVARWSPAPSVVGRLTWPQGKKKGKGGKKGKKGKKGGADVEATLSAPERFIKFQLETREQVLEVWRAKREELHAANAKLRVSHPKLVGVQRKQIDGIIESNASAAQRLQSKQEALALELRAAEQLNRDGVRADAAEIAELKQELEQTEERLSESRHQLRVLEHHKHVVGKEWAAKIQLLEQQRGELAEEVSGRPPLQPPPPPCHGCGGRGGVLPRDCSPPLAAAASGGAQGAGAAL